MRRIKIKTSPEFHVLTLLVALLVIFGAIFVGIDELCDSQQDTTHIPSSARQPLLR